MPRSQDKKRQRLINVDCGVVANVLHKDVVISDDVSVQIGHD